MPLKKKITQRELDTLLQQARQAQRNKSKQSAIASHLSILIPETAIERHEIPSDFTERPVVVFYTINIKRLLEFYDYASSLTSLTIQGVSNMDFKGVNLCGCTLTGCLDYWSVDSNDDKLRGITLSSITATKLATQPFIARLKKLKGNLIAGYFPKQSSDVATATPERLPSRLQDMQRELLKKHHHKQQGRNVTGAAPAPFAQASPGEKVEEAAAIPVIPPPEALAEKGEEAAAIPVIPAPEALAEKAEEDTATPGTLIEEVKATTSSAESSTTTTELAVPIASAKTGEELKPSMIGIPSVSSDRHDDEYSSDVSEPMDTEEEPSLPLQRLPFFSFRALSPSKENLSSNFFRNRSTRAGSGNKRKHYPMKAGSIKRTKRQKRLLEPLDLTPLIE